MNWLYFVENCDWSGLHVLLLWLDHFPAATRLCVSSWHLHIAKHLHISHPFSIYSVCCLCLEPASYGLPVCILSSLSETSVFVFDSSNHWFVTQDNDIYIMGRNGEHAPLGCGSSEFIRQSKRTTDFRKEQKAVMCCISWQCFSAGVGIYGYVYSTTAQSSSSTLPQAAVTVKWMPNFCTFTWNQSLN